MKKLNYQLSRVFSDSLELTEKQVNIELASELVVVYLVERIEG